MKFCERCEKSPAIPKQRFCKDCRRAVLSEAYEAGKVLPINVGKSFSDERGRSGLRSTQTLGGTPLSEEDEP